MKSKWIQLCLLLATLIIAGCVTTVTTSQLNKAVAKHNMETINWVSYMGSKDGYHYLRHGHSLCAKTYRIQEQDLRIDNPYPFTSDDSKWRPLKNNWEGWPMQIKTNDSQPGAPTLPLAP